MAEDISKFKMWEGTKGFRDEMKITVLHHNNFFKFIFPDIYSHYVLSYSIAVNRCVSEPNIHIYLAYAVLL